MKNSIIILVSLFLLLSCEEKDQDNDITSIEINPSIVTINTGGTQYFTAIARDAEGNIVDEDVDWFSSNDSIASIDNDGLALGVSAGTAIIYATAQEISGEAILHVEDDAAQTLVGTWTLIEMEKRSIYLASEDSTTQALGYAIGDTVADGSLLWAHYSVMGVRAELELKIDGTFTFTGVQPFDNDTLGYSPQVINLMDVGTWTYNEASSTIHMEGQLSELDGFLGLFEYEDSVIMIHNFNQADPSVRKVLYVIGEGYMDILVDCISTTTRKYRK